MTDLAAKHCVPCDEGVPPLSAPDAHKLAQSLSGWQLNSDATALSKQYSLKNFADALQFVNRIGAIAESENHHPDISLSWGTVGITLSTHAIGGLSENDFILAAKIDQIQ